MPEIPDLASQCIKCGFCLESCPTFLLTGDESQSPRGRITLANQAHLNKNYDPSTQAALDTCLGCRACETACPSGVQYGKILELARSEQPQNPHHKTLINTLSNHRLARIQFALAQIYPGKTMPKAVSQLVSGQDPQANTPTQGQELPYPHLNVKPTKGQVALLEGCVMRVLYPEVHQATRRLLLRAGYEVLPVDLGCCGALHAHAGLLPEAEQRAQDLAQKLPPDIPLIINSAGCGSTIKEYGQLIGQNLQQIADRTFDLTEFLYQQDFIKNLTQSPGLPNVTLTYHDACHLAHGQKITDAPRQLLQAIPGITFTELPESDLCCGSAGTYNLFQPTKARQLLDRKYDNIKSTKASIVATGNPGCHAWIAQAATENNSPTLILHTATVLEAAFNPILPD